MSSFNKSVAVAVFLSLVFASFVAAAPWPKHAKHSTHRRHIVGRGLHVESFHPRSTYQTYGSGKDHPNPALLKRDNSLQAAASSFVSSELGLDQKKVQFRASHSGPIADYAFLRQHYDGIPFANAVANVAMKQGKIVAFGNSFVDDKKIAPSTPSFELTSAINIAETSLGGKHNNITPSLEYFVKSDGSVALTHVVQVRNDDDRSFYQAFVDAHSGKLLSVVDFVAKAAYTVLPITKTSLDEGEETLHDPADLEASPFGWHGDGNQNSDTTSGNNVVAFIGQKQNVTNASGANQTFDYPYDQSAAPTAGKNSDAARTNGFYIYNTVHDIAYRYGFTETAFNFQTSNFGKGGTEDDPVLVSVQDASGLDNAFFSTPPDGQPGETSMFLWDATTPMRDGVLENDIPVHEATHGITNRMTGGGTGSCLSTLEAGGMGEGWSDAMAEWVQQKDENVKDFVLGAFVTNNPAGIRSHPYSTSKDVNPYTYSTAGTFNEVHSIGEVWANMLHNVFAALVKEHGFSNASHTDPSGQEGNVVFLHLFIDALLLQPCNPRFQDARDAWIQADANRYNGQNKCLIWQQFASRGLGQNAQNFADDFTVPAECQGSTSSGNGTQTGGGSSGTGSGSSDDNGGENGKVESGSSDSQAEDDQDAKQRHGSWGPWRWWPKHRV